jgi:hypothetical protein
MAISFLFLIVGLGGCALLAVAAVAVVWAIVHDRNSSNS